MTERMGGDCGGCGGGSAPLLSALATPDLTAFGTTLYWQPRRCNGCVANACVANTGVLPAWLQTQAAAGGVSLPKPRRVPASADAGWWQEEGEHLVKASIACVCMHACMHANLQGQQTACLIACTLASSWTPAGLPASQAACLPAQLRHLVETSQLGATWQSHHILQLGGTMQCR